MNGVNKLELEEANQILSAAADMLVAYVDRIERLEDEKSAIAEDIKTVYKELGDNGLDKKIVRKVIALRKKDESEREEEEALLETYMRALGMIESAGVTVAEEVKDYDAEPE